MKPIITIIFVCALICFSGAASAYVIDHDCTDITQIPESAITTAKTNLHIAYGHTSHGSQLISGMGTNQASNNQLDNFLSNSTVYQTTPGLFIWNDGPMAGALDLDDNFMGGDVGYHPQWVNYTEYYLGDPNPGTGRGTSHPDVNVIIWSWCGQAAGKTEQGMIDTYLAPMTQLETKYPGIKFVYMTGHLNGTGETGNLHLRNEQIRAYCIANNKILYDFADIESYDPDGLVNYMVLDATDNCDYDSDGNGSRDKNWATDWENAHTLGVHWWESGASHSQDLNGNLKGYAAWWLWARIAGWDGGSGLDVETPTVPQNLTATAASQSQIDLSWTASTDNVAVTGYRIFRGGTEIATTASTTYSNTGLNSSTTYQYTVTAYDAAGNESSQSNSANATTQVSGGDTEAPTIPQNLTATSASHSQIDLTWDASNDNVAVTGHRIFRDGTEIATTASPNYSDTGLTPSTTCTYTVSAYDAEGNESSQSDSASVTTQESGSSPGSGSPDDSGEESGDVGCFIGTALGK